jgi:hypothetical protein
MGITPIERLKAWFVGLFVEDKCHWCKKEGETFRASGGYRYCSNECADDDADAQTYSF